VHHGIIGAFMESGEDVGFTTEWTVEGDEAARTIILPLVDAGGAGYDCIVDWGDGSALSVVTAFNDADREHIYDDDGTYKVEITGQCEGWSFNNGGDKLKFTDIINQGDESVFDGFKYLRGGFYGCTNLASLGGGEAIPASGAGITTDGFYDTFKSSGITSVPTGLFDNHTSVAANAYRQTFQDTAITSIPTDLFRLGVSASTNAFTGTFQSSSITTIPTDTFRYNTLVTGFTSTFQSSSITTIPTDTFRYNTPVTGFTSTFHSSSITTIPTDTFRYNTLVTGFTTTFRFCALLETVPADLFRYNILGTTFYRTFEGCNKLQQNKNIFYQDGAQTTRFVDQAINFGECFKRTSFTGTKGTAPDLWECDFGEVITLDVSPGTDWDPADIITGQASGATSEVVSKTDATHYKIKKLEGTYDLNEIIGVTGTPAKLADQGADFPTIAGSPTRTNCWDGAGNDGDSLDNYGDIPADWI